MGRKAAVAVLDVDAVLADAEQKTKESVAQGAIPVYPQDLPSLDKLREIGTQIEGLVADAQNLQNPIMEKVVEFHKSRNATELFATSVRVKGEKSKALVSFTCRYSAIPKASEPMLKEITKETLETKEMDFEDFFTEDKGVELKKDADLKELIGALGPELFKKLFVVNRTLKPTRFFHESRRKTFSEKQNALMDQYVKQAAASFKFEA